MLMRALLKKLALPLAALESLEAASARLAGLAFWLVRWLRLCPSLLHVVIGLTVILTALHLAGWLL